MKDIMNILVSRTKALMTVLLLMATSVAWAGNTIVLNDGAVLSINPGETKEIAINLENDDNLTNVMCDIVIGNGLSLVDGTFRSNLNRIDRDSHITSLNKISDNIDGSTTYRMVVLTQDLSQIPGNTGAIAYFKVETNAAFGYAGSSIKVTNAQGDNDGAACTVEGSTLQLAQSAGTIGAAVPAVTLMPGEKHTVEVVLNNTISNLCAMQMNIQLPKGLQVTKKDNGKLKFNYTDRLPDGVVISANVASSDPSLIKLAIYSMENKLFVGDEGTLFSFEVEPSETEDVKLAENSSIEFSNIIAATNQNSNNTFYFEKFSVDVTYGRDAFEAVTAVVNGLQESLKTATESINNSCVNVKDSTFITTPLTDISKEIAAMQTALDNAVADKSLIEKKDEIIAPKDEIEAAIAKVLDDAVAAQKSYEAEQAKIAANKAANDSLTAVLNALQKKMDDAVAVVNNDCKDVAADYAETQTTIQQQIDALKADLKAKFEAVELTAESTVDTTAVATAIDTMVAEAKAAQKAYEDEQAAIAAKIAANKAANDSLTAVLDALQKKMDDAVAVIKKDCKDVAADYAETQTTIQQQIDALKADLKAKFEAVELTAESTVDTTAVATAIDTMVAEAKAAQKAYEELQAKIAVNDAVYETLGKQLDKVQQKLDIASMTIDMQCSLVAADFKAVADSIQNEIDKLEEALNSLYAELALTEESTIDTESISQAIDKMLKDAQEKQQIALGISGVQLEKMGIDKVYDLNGKRTDNMLKGQMYIIRTADGKVKKMMLK